MPMARAASRAPTTASVSSDRNAIIVAMIEGVNERLAKIEEGIILLARVEERHEALEKSLAVHTQDDIESHRHLNASIERTVTLLDKMDERVDALERHRDVSVDNREAKRYWWVLIGGLITAVGGIALVAVEYWNGHLETTRQIESLPPIIEYHPPAPVTAQPRSESPTAEHTH